MGARQDGHQPRDRSSPVADYGRCNEQRAACEIRRNELLRVRSRDLQGCAPPGADIEPDL